MLNLKKTAVAVLAFGSSAVFAGSMGPVCSAVNVTVPCESTAWAFGAKALYLKPNFSSDPGFYVAATGGNQQPNYQWGFEVEGAYHFNTGNDLNINWSHVNKSKSRSFGATRTEGFNFGGSTTSSVTGVSGTGSIDPKWDAVNIEFGQHVDFGDNKAIRFHGGAQYARMTNDINRSSTDTLASSVAGTAVTGTYTHTTNYSPTYNGFGPRVGADMAYDWGNGLGMYANAATGLLAGTSAYQATFEDSRGNSRSGSSSKTTVVPLMDAKLGATYTYAMAQGDLTVDAGWMWINYFNAHQKFNGDTADFALQGPFVGLKWLGNIV